MKTLKGLTILIFIVFMTCSPALSVINVQQYLNPDVTVNQTAIESAIAGGSDPITLASDLAMARCDMALSFAESVATAAPNIDLEALKNSVNAAVAQACPDKAEQVSDALQAAFPPADNTFQATNTLTNTNPDLQNQNSQVQQNQIQKHFPSPSN